MKISKYIDHTLLDPKAKKADIERLCNEAIEYDFKSVCVNPYYSKLVKSKLKDTGVLTCVVLGFPLGSVSKEVKTFEAKEAYKIGIDELDMVINIGALKDKEYEVVYEDIKSVVDNFEGKTVKVIIETGLLTEEEKIKACELAVKGGANYVKTSTGFLGKGAKQEDIVLMRKVVGENIGVKASGGIKSYEIAIGMVRAGASRIGTSSGLNILEREKETLG